MRYDADGNLRFATDFNGKTTEYQYDAMNRLRFRIPDASLAEAGVEWRYTASGQQERMIDGHGVTLYGYDDRDRLQTKTSPEGVVTYGYDAGNDVTSIATGTPQGASVTYGYDHLNRLQTVTDVNQQQTTYGYDENGNLGNVALPNGLSASYGYDAMNRLSGLAHYTAANLQAPIVSYAYGLFATGQRRAVQEGTGRTCVYGYDNLWRLTGETITADPHAKNGILGYTYDAVGNRQTRTSTVASLSGQSFGYDADDRVQGDGYDANGNTKYGAASQPASAYASQPSTTNSQPVLGADTYDSQNRLTQRNGASGSVQVTYDGDGNKVAETVTQNNVTTTTSYLVDSLNPTGYAQVLEEKTNGILNRVYTRGHELISQDQILGTGTNAAWAVSYYGYDGHGNVRFLSDGNGNITDSYDFDAFGNLLNIGTVAQSGGGFAPPTLNVHLYCAEQFEGALGMYFLRARLMNPLTGRFWTADSYEGDQEDPASLHRYLYVEASPVCNWDPTGHEDLAELEEASAIDANIESKESEGEVQSERNAAKRNKQFTIFFGVRKFSTGAGGIEFGHAFLYALRDNSPVGTKYEITVKKSELMKLLGLSSFSKWTTTLSGSCKVQNTVYETTKASSMLWFPIARHNLGQFFIWNIAADALAYMPNPLEFRYASLPGITDTVNCYTWAIEAGVSAAIIQWLPTGS